MLLISSGAMSLSIAGLGCSFYFQLGPDAQVVFLQLCVASFSLGLGSAAYVFIAEVFTNRARSKGVALSLFVSRVFSGISTFTFPMLSQLISVGGVFFIYSAITAL